MQNKGLQTWLHGNCTSLMWGIHLKKWPWILPDNFQCYNILVVADYFSKWRDAYSVPTTDAPKTAKIFEENWILHYAVLLEQHTDQGRNLESNLFSEMCKQLIQPEQHHSSHSRTEWLNNSKEHPCNNIYLGSLMSIRLGLVYSAIHVGILIFN